MKLRLLGNLRASNPEIYPIPDKSIYPIPGGDQSHFDFANLAQVIV